MSRMANEPAPQPKRRWPLNHLHFAGLFVLLVAGGVGLIVFGLRSQPGHNTSHNSTVKHQTPPQTAVVEITPSGFLPTTISVNPPARVTWVNEDVMPHLPAADPYPTHTEMPNLVAPRALGQKETYSFLFTKKETIHYHDDLNPILTGTVEVR